MGKASALAYVLFAIILILTAIQTRIYRKGDRA
jgi:ABC-type sugar transport system permease subunit